MANKLHIKIKNVLLVLSLLGGGIFSSSVLYAQDPSFTQGYCIPAYISPGYAGNEAYTRIVAGYRNEYPSLGKAFATYVLYADMAFESIKSGASLMVMRDELGGGLYSYNYFNLSYAYKLEINENWYFKPGLAVGGYLSQRDPSKLEFPDMLGSAMPSLTGYDKLNSFSFDFGAGVTTQIHNLYAGIGVFHIGNSASEDFAKKDLKITANLGVDIPVGTIESYSRRQGGKSSAFLITPNVIYTQQSELKVMYLGSNFSMNFLDVGLYAKTQPDFKRTGAAICLGIDLGRVNINYAFDWGISGSNYKGFTASSHEVFLTVKLESNNRSDYYQTRRGPIRRYKCP